MVSVELPETSIGTLAKKSKVEYIVTNAIILLTFIAFGFIAIMSFFQTSTLDPEKYGIEHILFDNDSLYVNLIILLSFIIITFNLNKLYRFFAKVNTKFVYIGLFIYVLSLGLLWIFSVWQIPGADSANVFETATEVINGDFSSLKNGQEFYFSEYYNNISYYNYYPFQLGFVFISEIVYRIFGTETSMPIQVINVICTAFAYCGIARISRIVFKRKSIEFISCILLLGCLQPILLCTFPYGNIIGMCFSIWASYFLIKYLQTDKSILILPCIIFISIAILAKYNSLIYAVAFSICLIINSIRKRKIKSLAFMLALCLCAIFVNNLVIMSYEKRANVKLESGVSQLLYLDMGLNESYMAPGWYGGQFMGYYKDNNCDVEKAEELAKEDIKKRVNKFTSSPLYTYKFFTSKVLSQWNEPTYECIWVSKTKGHIYEPNALATSVYEGSLGNYLNVYFNQYMQILFLLFAVGLISLILRKKAEIESTLLPLVLLGAFGYHLLFEAKSQYSLTYIIIMIPTASYAVQSVFFDSYNKITNLVTKLKTAHITTKKSEQNG